jgi:hypothetical protein
MVLGSQRDDKLELTLEFLVHPVHKRDLFSFPTQFKQKRKFFSSQAFFREGGVRVLE